MKYAILLIVLSLSGQCSWGDENSSRFAEYRDRLAQRRAEAREIRQQRRQRLTEGVVDYQSPAIAGAPFQPALRGYVPQPALRGYVPQPALRGYAPQPALRGSAN